MILFDKDMTNDVAVIAEIGVNHEGDPDAALKLLRLAAEAGADAVKFQSYTPERYASASDPARLERVRRFSLPFEAHVRLAEEAKRLGVKFFSTPLTEDWVDILDPLVPAFKIASGDLVFELVIRAAARTGKPVLISTGLGTMEEIDRAVSWVRDEVGAPALADRLVLLHCVSAYPTPIEQASVRSVPFLKERYGVTVGYSNHVASLAPCYAAVALGAQVIEVHVTDQKTGREFRDHALSLEPAELRELVGTVKEIRASLGDFGKAPMPCELPAAAAMRKGVVAARPLAAGQTIVRGDLMFARPATEFAASELTQLVGRTLTAARQAGELIRRSDVK